MILEKATKGSPATAGTETHYYHYDANGNVTETVDSNGDLTASYEYGPFGELVSEIGTYAQENTYKFSTKPQDEETGYFYYGFRYYDSANGRWLNRDPIREEGGINFYSFVFNTPVIFWDYLGLEKKMVDGGFKHQNQTPENVEYVEWYAISANKINAKGEIDNEGKCPCEYIDVEWQRHQVADIVADRLLKKIQMERLYGYEVFHSVGTITTGFVTSTLVVSAVTYFSSGTATTAALGYAGTIGATVGAKIGYEVFDKGWKKTGYEEYIATNQRDTLKSGVRVWLSEETKTTNEDCSWAP